MTLDKKEILDSFNSGQFAGFRDAIDIILGYGRGGVVSDTQLREPWTLEELTSLRNDLHSQENTNE